MVDPPSPRLRRTWSLCLLRGYTFLFVSFLRCALFRSYTDAFDFDARQFAPMSNRPVIAFSPLKLERDNLFILPLLDDFSSYLCSRDKRGPVRHVLSICEQKHVAKRCGLAGLNVEEIDINRVAFCDAKLSATGPDNCVSHKRSGRKKAAQNSTDRRTWQTQSLGNHLSSIMLSRAKHLWSISVRESVKIDPRFLRFAEMTMLVGLLR
jgi:hypothetical protein